MSRRVNTTPIPAAPGWQHDWKPDDEAMHKGERVRVIGYSKKRDYLVAVEYGDGWIRPARDFELVPLPDYLRGDTP